MQPTYHYVYFTSERRWRRPWLLSLSQDHGALEHYEGGLRFRGVRNRVEMQRVLGITLLRNGTPWAIIGINIAIILAVATFDIMLLMSGARADEAGIFPWLFALLPLLSIATFLLTRRSGDWLCVEYTTDDAPGTQRAYFRESTSVWRPSTGATAEMYEALLSEPALAERQAGAAA